MKKKYRLRQEAKDAVGIIIFFIEILVIASLICKDWTVVEEQKKCYRATNSYSTESIS